MVVLKLGKSLLPVEAGSGVSLSQDHLAHLYLIPKVELLVNFMVVELPVLEQLIITYLIIMVD